MVRAGALVLAAGLCATTQVAGASERMSETAVLAEINRARTQPRTVAADLRRYRAAFQGRVAREPGEAIGVTTNEGVRAVDEAIAFLERQAPLPPLAHGSVLARAAQGWAAEQGRAGGHGHRSGGSVSAGARVRAAGGDIYVGETISYGMDTPARVVRQLIVDDGQPSRGHRALLFSTGFRYAGVGCGGHARWGSMCVVDLASTPDGGPAPSLLAAAQPARAIALSR